MSLVNEPRRSIPEDEWRARFAEALARLRARVPADLSPEGIEAEITSARADVRRERAKQRNS